MNIQSGFDGLKSLLGVTQSTAANTSAVSGTAATETSVLGFDRATLSSAGSQVAQLAGDGDVRSDKVAQIQSALATGTYNIPSSAVASKMIDSMLGAAS